MNALQQLNKEDIPGKIPAAGLRTTQILQVAFITGPIIFFGCLLVLHVSDFTLEQTAEMELGNPDLVMTLLLVLLLVTVGALFAVSLVPGMLLKPEKLAKQAAGSDPVVWMLNLHRLVTIIRMAVIEGVALFGLVVLMLPVLGRYIGDVPMAWLGVVPLVVHVLYGLATFPTRGNVATFLHDRILQPLRRRGL